MPNSRCSSRSSSCSQPPLRPPSMAEPPPPPPQQQQQQQQRDDPNDGRGDEIQPCPAGYLSNHPMAHTPPPPPPPQEEEEHQRIYENRQQFPPPPVLTQQHQPAVKPIKERRLPTRSGSTASLFSPFASLTRRLGAKHKSAKSTVIARTCFNLMLTFINRTSLVFLSLSYVTQRVERNFL